jgi:hypothetical protein
MSQELAKELRERQERPKYQSLGGWLILPAIGLLGFLVRTLAQLIKAIETLVGSKAWTILTTPGSPEYHPNWAPLIVYELCCYCLILAVGVVLAVCFEKKKWKTGKTWGRYPRFSLFRWLPAGGRAKRSRPAQFPFDPYVKVMPPETAGWAAWIIVPAARYM